MKASEIIALILALTTATVYLIIIGGAIYGALFLNRPISESGQEQIQIMTTALISVISMYLGHQMKS